MDSMQPLARFVPACATVAVILAAVAAVCFGEREPEPRPSAATLRNVVVAPPEQAVPRTADCRGDCAVLPVAPRESW